jgi:molybdopterin synthase sulfur carrier subunit
MKIKLLYFGRPREILNTSGETVDVPDGIATLAEMLAWLRIRGENWALELTDKRVRCAINQEVAALSDPIHEQDEIAVFSSISGG